MSEERRNNDTRESVAEMVAAIRQDVAEVKETTTKIETSLFGLPGQPGMGFVTQTKERLDNHGERLGKVETRVLLWAGGLGVLVPAVLWAANHFLK